MFVGRRSFGRNGSGLIAPTVKEYLGMFTAEKKQFIPGSNPPNLPRPKTSLSLPPPVPPPAPLFRAGPPLGIPPPPPLPPEFTSWTIQLPQALSQEEHELMILCPHRIDAFLVDRKLWVWVLVSGISDIKWYPEPYEALQLSKGKKDLIKALVESIDQEDSIEGFDDVVEGKGKGLIFLLHGPPGLGKTFTAGEL